MSEAYRAAGVDIDAGNEAVRRIKEHVRRTRRREVIGDIGGFGGLFRPEILRSARAGFRHGRGGDQAEDRLCPGPPRHHRHRLRRHVRQRHCGAGGGAPVFSRLSGHRKARFPNRRRRWSRGWPTGCVEAGCALIGGETAEMPDMYAPGEYDIAGFCVGVAERERLLTATSIRPGDVLLGLSSSGLHSNGFSLARKVLLSGGPDRLGKSSPRRVAPWGRSCFGRRGFM